MHLQANDYQLSFLGFFLPSQPNLKSMEKLKIGVIREGKVPPDKRVPLSPKQCKHIIDTYPEIDFVVQPSPIRKYQDSEFSGLGITLQEDLSDRDILIGVKEVPIDILFPKKTYFFFSHTFKFQPYNDGYKTQAGQWFP